MSQHQHYEWAVLNPDGGNESGIFTSGPHAPKAELVEGGQRHGTGMYDEFGDEETRITHLYPEGSFVARRLVTYGEWEPADDSLYPPKREEDK